MTHPAPLAPSARRPFPATMAPVPSRCSTPAANSPRLNGGSWAAHPFWRWVLGLSLLGCLLLLGACQSLPDNRNRTVSHAWAQPASTALGQLTAQRRQHAKAKSANGFKLLERADEAYSARLALVEAARHTLDLQYYALNLDASSASLLDAIHKASQRGVRVRLLLDDFNTAGDNAQVLRMAFLPNVEVRLFNPVAGSRNSLPVRMLGALPRFATVQQRMHNKLFLADNAAGITGGRNLGDAYFGLGIHSNFIDLDVLAFGPVVQEMGRSFDKYWNDPMAYPAERLVSLEELRTALVLSAHADELNQATDTTALIAKDLREVAAHKIAQMREHTRALPEAMPLHSQPLLWVPAQFIVDHPSKISNEPDLLDSGEHETVVDGLLALMQMARREVLLVTPYFVPGPKIMATFRDMRARGVHIRVLTNSLASNDAVAAHAGYARYRKDLLRLGIELHELRGVADGADAQVRSTAILSGSGSGTRSPERARTSPPNAQRLSLHSKFAVFDSRLVLIGSMNLDLRSKLQNTEVGLVLASRQMAQTLTESTQATLSRASYRVTLDQEALKWHAPSGANFPSTRSEPDASVQLRMLANLIAPFAPDELL